MHTVSIQQDYLESFFGRMRSGNGDNTNPSQEQFSANFRRTLVNRELTCSALSNCVDNLDILTVSSAQINQQHRSFEQDLIMVINEDQEREVLHDDESEEILFEESESAEETVNSLAESLGVANTAGCIEALIEKNKIFNCVYCLLIFEQNEKIGPRLFVQQKKVCCHAKAQWTFVKLATL